MKFRLGLFIFLLPLMAFGQSANPQGVVFFSKGKMYVKYKDGTTAGESESTTLHIDGSAKFATGAGIKQKGRTELTGDFINAKDPAQYTSDVPNLFMKDAVAENEGVIAFVGKPYLDASNIKKATQQRIYGVVDDPSSKGIPFQKKVNWINFPTISIEKGDWTAVESDATSAGKNDWRQVGLVLVDTSAAVSVDFIKANNRNRFAVKASYQPTVARITSGFADVKDLHSSMKSDPTAVARYSQINLDLYKFSDTEDDGAFLSDDLSNSNSKVTDPTTFGKTLRTSASDGNISGEAGWNYLTGFSPPFAELGADYMLYHTMTKPNGGSITSYEGPNVDPFFRMKAGRGYFITMEATHSDHGWGSEDINARWDFEGDHDGISPNGPEGIHNTKRFRGGYVFNREIFYDYLSAPKGEMENFSRFLYDNSNNWFDPNTNKPAASASSVDAHGNAKWPLVGLKAKGMSSDFLDEDGSDRSRYELMDKEKFNTGEVEVDLVTGLNFLGNPFMFPISLNPLLGFPVSPTTEDPLDPTNDSYTSRPADEATAEDGYEVPELTPTSSSTPIKASSLYIDADPNVVLRGKYWVINQALVKYDVAENIYRYRTSYDYISRDGSTVVSKTMQGSSNIGQGIANPLGYLVSPMQLFCVQASKPVKISLKPSLRRFGLTRFPKSAAKSAENVVLKDWFAVEAKADGNEFSDRTAIVFRDQAKPQYDGYDTKKGLTDQYDTYNDVLNGKSTKNKQEENKAIVYTKTKDGVSLLGNGVPKNTKELALYYAAPVGTQEMTLRFYGLENLESVPGVWLIDRYLDNKTIELTPESEYTFVSDGTNENNAEIDNRFILRFYDAKDGMIDPDEIEITCYYDRSVLHVSGLNEGDLGSEITLYDLQGRLMGKTKVNEYPSMTYPKPLALGTYIAKITGKRNHTSKFVNLQN